MWNIKAKVIQMITGAAGSLIIIISKAFGG
jgi:hypothetical protein